MKILFSGYHNPHFMTITEYLEDAIKVLGHELFVFDDRSHIVPGRIRKRIRWLDIADNRYINKKLILLADKTKPEMVIITGGHRIKADTINHLKKWNVRTVLWTIDAPLNFEPLIEAAPSYDRIFCQGTEAIELFSQAGIQGAVWLPMACAPEYHRPVTLSADEKKQFGNDLVFVGSFYPNRLKLLEQLAGFDLGIWGPGWDRLPQDSALRQSIRGNHVKPEVWVKIYSASKIVLAPHFHDPGKRFLVYQASPKIFEALACGAFIISDMQRDVLSLFKRGTHLECFTDAADLIEKINYYLANPADREKIARQGRQEAVCKHTYRERIEKLISIVSQN